jgi:hypothetical protein
MPWSEAIPKHPADYYRQKAIWVRQAAEEVKTPAVKVLLFAEALHCEHLAAKVDRVEDEAEDF